MSELIIDGRYKVVKTLSGGMGTIHLCFDLAQENSPVAIKTIKSDFLVEPDARSKFLREVNIWIQLGGHPNIVQAHKVQFIPTTHEIYVVTDWVQPPTGIPDPSLRSWIAAGNINLSRAFKFGLQIARGMKFATNVIPDLVHRDLKPENVLVGYDEIAKINDFGIASSVMSRKPLENKFTDAKGIKTYSGVGTLPYMSPEQCQAQTLDCRSDIYAYGLILYELLTGKMAVLGQNELEIISLHINGFAYKRVGNDISDVNIKNFIQKCVYPLPKGRFANWGELEAALQSLYSSINGEAIPEDEYPIEVSEYSFYQKANSYLAIGAAYIDTGENEKAQEFTNKSLEMAQRISAPRIEAAALSNLGLINFQVGEYERAIKFYEAAEKINFKLYDLINQSTNLGNIGGAYQKVGNIEAAQDYFVRSYVIAKSEGIPSVQAAQLGNLAVSFMEQADFAKAINYYQQAINILESHGAEVALCTNLGNLANVLILQGNLDRAESLFQQAYDLAKKNGVKPQQSIILGNLANVLIAKGDNEHAVLVLSEAIKISEENGDQSSLCKQLASMGTVYANQQEYVKAKRYFDQALSISIKINETNSTASILLGIANLYVAAGRFNDAVPVLIRCIDINHKLNNRHTEASAMGNLGKVYAALGNFQEAITYLQKSIDIAKEIGAEEIEGRAAWTIGVMYQMMGKSKAALDYMRNAVRIFRNYNLPEYEEAALHLRDFMSQFK